MRSRVLGNVSPRCFGPRNSYLDKRGKRNPTLSVKRLMPRRRWKTSKEIRDGSMRIVLHQEFTLGRFHAAPRLGRYFPTMIHTENGLQALGACSERLSRAHISSSASKPGHRFNTERLWLRHSPTATLAGVYRILRGGVQGFASTSLSSLAGARRRQISLEKKRI